MNVTKNYEKPLWERKCVDTDGLRALLSCGRNSAIEIGTAAGARVSIGRRVLWNVSKVQQYLDLVSK